MAVRAAWRFPLLACGMLAMVWGMWLGLARLGWRMPLPRPEQLVVHGPLMVCGFLGTLISLERAVGLNARWAYGAPVLAAAGALVALVGPPGPVAPLLFAGASAVLVAIFLVVCRRQPALFTLVMAIAAAAWLVGNVRWVEGTSIYRLVVWWVLFLVLTIAGERLELNRVLRPVPGARALFVIAAGLTVAGALLTLRSGAVSVRVFGAGLAGLAFWLARYDVARRTVRQHGLTRFMAVALLAGYAWLAAGATLMAVVGTLEPGPAYDAMLHAVLLGFVMSMVFAHAPVIFPAVLGMPLRYRQFFYSHLAVLHASVAIRVAADLVESLGRWRAWGGLLNAAALLLFVVNTAQSVDRN